MKLLMELGAGADADLEMTTRAGACLSTHKGLSRDLRDETETERPRGLQTGRNWR